MSKNQPLWQRRTVISSKRNVSVVLWPPSQDQEGHEYPPSIVLQEGKNVGTTEQPNWQNKDIRLTLDKLPKILVDLQLAYQKAVDLEEGEVSTGQAVSPESKEEPKLPGQIYKVVKAEGPVQVDTLAQRFAATPEEVKAAIGKLKEQGLVEIQVKDWQAVVEVKS